MDEEYEIENSPLSQKITKDNVTVEVCIYRGKGDPKWILEVVDQEGGSTVWQDEFATDREALAEAINVIETEGIASFLHGGRSSLH